MEFIAILIAFAVERWTAFGRHIRTFQLLEKYIALFKDISAESFLGLAFIIVPVLIVLLIIYLIFLHIIFGILAFIFGVAILLYCFGQFDLESHAKIGHLNFSNDQEQEIASIIFQANQNIFAVLFWFMLLGPVGAVLYRLTVLLVQHHESETITQAAEKFLKVLDWIPVRIETLSYALVSHFIAVLKCWIMHVLKPLDQNDLMLSECGFAALEIKQHKEFTVENLQKEILRLVDRALVIWLVVIALIVLF